MARRPALFVAEGLCSHVANRMFWTGVKCNRTHQAAIETLAHSVSLFRIQGMEREMREDPRQSYAIPA